MKTRRAFLSSVAIGSLAASIGVHGQPENESPKKDRPNSKFRPREKYGMGGVALGNGFSPTPDIQAHEALEGAWAAGVRFFDTAPFYGYGLSERRFGLALGNHPRDEYVLSTKVGRVLKPDAKAEGGLWKNVPAMTPEVDYSAAGTRRSIEDSLQRLGLSRIDIVFIHDLSPNFFGEQWLEYFEQAKKGAMIELTRMRDEGIIKAWGLGVNRIDPILKTLEVADADIFLSATQYSLVHHEEALEKLFPKCEEKGVSLVIGAPLNAGFLAGRDRYDYGDKIPDGMLEKRTKLETIAKQHQVDLRTAALQFSAAPSVVSAVIPGARTAQQASENARSMAVEIPPAFWEEVKRQELVSANAPLPGNG